MQAAADLGVDSWTLWNARCVYTVGALHTAVTPAAGSPAAVIASTDVKTNQNSR